MWPREWPTAAREIAAATDAAVGAAAAADAQALDASTTELAALPLDQIGAVHAAVVRELLEDLHPDGLSGNDIQAVFERCTRSAAGWLPNVDVAALATVLTGALGISDVDVDDTARRADRAGYTQCTILVIAITGGDPVLHEGEETRAGQWIGLYVGASG